LIERARRITHARRMEKIRLGITALEVTPLALGTWQLGGEWGDFDQREAVAAIRRARELGVNFFDTAQAYGFGASERLLGEALRDELRQHRDELVIATKGGLRTSTRSTGPTRTSRSRRRRALSRSSSTRARSGT